MSFPTADHIMQASPVMPVIVVEKAEDAVPIARALVDGGIRVLEVTLRTPAALEAIDRISQEVEGAIVGAGTVTTASQIEQVIERGAQFLISPGITPDLLMAGREAPPPFLPGIATVSELMTGLEAGLERFKFFPAQAAGGIATLKAFLGPFPDIAFCPTGGIGEDNFIDYLKLPNVACVGGSWVAPAARVRAGDWPGITGLARDAVEKAGQLSGQP